MKHISGRRPAGALSKAARRLMVFDLRKSDRRFLENRLIGFFCKPDDINFSQSAKEKRTDQRAAEETVLAAFLGWTRCL
jgi:hypothetical protein